MIAMTVCAQLLCAQLRTGAHVHVCVCVHMCLRVCVRSHIWNQHSRVPTIVPCYNKQTVSKNHKYGRPVTLRLTWPSSSRQLVAHVSLAANALLVPSE